jgi:uncharacterized lipoprotein YbaY
MGKITLRGWIQLPSTQVFEGAVAIVGLDDVTLIDAPSRRIAEAVIESVNGSLHRIPFRLEVEGSLSTLKRYVLTAEVRTSREERIHPGDFLTTVAVPWTPGDTGDNAVPVSRI